MCEIPPQHATAKGFSLSLNVRVDDGRALGGWRNTLDFDPLHRYGGFSYLQARLQACSLVLLVSPWTVVTNAARF